MERVKLPISELSLAQKLDMIESLWDCLRNTEEAVKSPQWHEAVLSDRDAALSAGKVTISDWDEAKERIKKKVS